MDRLPDYHMHLESDDARSPCPYHVDRIGVYVARARRAGIPEIGISEHSFRFASFRPAMESLLSPEGGQDPRVASWLTREFEEDLDRYVSAVLEARRAGMPVLLGIEVDYVAGAERHLAAALDGRPWDYVIGSVHFVDGRCIDCDPDITWPEGDVDEIWQRYYETMALAAQSRLFDVLAHPDLPKKFGRRPLRFPGASFENFLRAARAAAVAVEINTAGLRKAAREPYPAVELLRRMVEAGLDVHLGSDAHDPSEVGAGWEDALSLAREAGVTGVVRWRARARSHLPLPAR